MLCTEVQVNCRSGRRLLPDNENDLRELLHVPEKLMNITCSTEVAAMEIEFSETGAAFIGVVNETTGTVYYFDNGSGGEEPVELLINICPAEKMMCYDKDTITDIIMHFCATGEKSSKYSWIEEEV